MKIKEMIAVMQAFAEGKKVEVRPVGTDEWVLALTPVWNWSTFDYRIKPKTKLRPYTFEELRMEMAKGKVAVTPIMGYKRIYTIIQVSDDFRVYGQIQLSDWKNISYEQLLTEFQWLDGSPCGVIEEE